MTVTLVDDDVRAIYAADTAREQYYCRFGLNETYRAALVSAGLVVAGADAADGGTRIMRRTDHPFFVLTLFVPQARSTPEHPHPLITAYLVTSRERTRQTA